jgi:hypothetical protein
VQCNADANTAQKPAEKTSPRGPQCLDLLRSLMLLNFQIWTGVFVSLFNFGLQSPAPYWDIITHAQYALAQRAVDPVFETKWECRLNHLQSFPGSASIATQMLEYLIASGSLMGLGLRYPLAAFGSSHRLSLANTRYAPSYAASVCCFILWPTFTKLQTLSETGKQNVC